MLKLLHDEDDSLPLRIELLSTLMKGFKVSVNHAAVRVFVFCQRLSEPFVSVSVCVCLSVCLTD